MTEQGRSAARGLGLFLAGVLAAGTFAFTPAGAKVTLTLKKIFAKGDLRYIEEEELVRFGLVKMNVGDPDVPIIAVGPFALIGRCEQPDGPGTAVRARVLITTAEDNSSYKSNADEELDFDVADNPNPEVWAEGTGGAPGGPPDAASAADLVAASPSGTAIGGHTAVYTSFAGAHCAFSGDVRVHAGG